MPDPESDFVARLRAKREKLGKDPTQALGRSFEQVLKGVPSFASLAVSDQMKRVQSMMSIWADAKRALDLVAPSRSAFLEARSMIGSPALDSLIRVSPPSSLSLDQVRGFRVDLGANWAFDALRGPAFFRDYGRLTQALSGLSAMNLGFDQAKFLPDVSRTLTRFTEMTRHWVELQRKFYDASVDAFVARYGWSRKREVANAMRHLIRPRTRAFRTVREALHESPHLVGRRALIRQALRAFANEEWFLVINALMPLIEGVLVDVAFTRTDQPKKGRVTASLDRVKEADYDIQCTVLEQLVVAGTSGLALHERVDFANYGVTGEPRTMNRHAILHGAARRYGTAENALKLALLLVVTTEVCDVFVEETTDP
jgi:hypothetical protein